MATDDEIDDQIYADWEFTRRSEQLMSKLRNQDQTRSSTEDADREEMNGKPKQE